MEIESGESKISRKMPKAVPFVLTNMFFERFCSNGILSKLKFSLKSY